MSTTPTSVAARPARNGEAVPYDFRRQHRIATDRLRSLKAMYERVVRSLEGWLLSRARADVELSLQSVERLSFGEFARALPNPCASFTFEIRDSGGREGVIDFGLDFAFFLVDRLFGGTAEPIAPARALTPLERIGVRTVADRVRGFVADAWRDAVTLDLELTGFESVPDILRVASPEDPVVVTTIGVKLGERTSRLQICLPFTVLEHFFTGTYERRAAILGTAQEQEETHRLAETALRATHVSVAARLPAFLLSLRELRDLRQGSVVATGIPCTAPLDVLIGGQRRFLATPGRVGSTLAVRVSEGVLRAPDPVTIPYTKV